MFNQHATWLEVTSHLPSRRTIASVDHLRASHVWRQDHNGFTHQDPRFIDHVVNNKAEVNVVDLMKLQPHTEHPQDIDTYGQDLPDICQWKWGATNGGTPA